MTTFKYKAEMEGLKLSDEIPIGAVIVGRAIIHVSSNGVPYNTYSALVYEHGGKRFAIYLDKSVRVFRSVPL